MTRICALIIIVIAAVTVGSPLAAQTDTVFTYQGELKENGGPANGTFDVDFGLWDDPAAGNQVGSTNTFNSLPILEGLFTVELDFGASAFDNNDRWLEITVAGVPLVPRQRVTRAPYAIQTRGIFVDEDSNVGIGTSTPSSPLQVESNAEFSIYVQNTGTGASTTAGTSKPAALPGSAYTAGPQPRTATPPPCSASTVARPGKASTAWPSPLPAPTTACTAEA